MYKTLTSLLAANILINFIIQAIIVEKNLYAYYRLPTTTIKTSNASEDYYILQCPFKASMNIPKPNDMPVCLIVGRHSENAEKPKDISRAKPRAVLNTQVDYRYLNPPPSKLVKLVRIKNGKPYTMFLKPINKKDTKTSTLIKEPHKLFLASPKTGLNQTKSVLYTVPLIRKLPINDSLPLSSAKEVQKSFQDPRMPLTTIPPDDCCHDLPDEEDTGQGPLKYLAVPDTLKKLQRTTKHLPQLGSGDRTEYKSEKFFADLENYKKGFRTKGFQNMYHRDEIYKDHIFYDDLQQLGNYHIKENLQQKQP